nr:AbrB/MazE/SpoVT family DNA-binding domain-containing protein [Candidatus Levybacteria bacterium]
MERKIVRIGNSYGIVLPQAVLKLAGFGSKHKLKMRVEKNKIVLTPLSS